LTNSGWQYEGKWDSFLDTPIAPQYFIAAHHVGGTIGQTFTYNGVGYVTTAYWDDTNTDLRIWKINGTLPSYARLYTTNNELGKTLVVIGHGTQRGSPVIVEQAQTVYTTNVVNLNTLGISPKTAQDEFPETTFSGKKGNTIMTVVTSDLVTNIALAGWQDGPSDGVMRWGQNQVCAAGGLLVGAFTGTQGTNEAYLSCGDSSGAVFIQVITKKTAVWKLAGINTGWHQLWNRRAVRNRPEQFSLLRRDLQRGQSLRWRHPDAG
jgi:hypothetical protein